MLTSILDLVFSVLCCAVWPESGVEDLRRALFPPRQAFFSPCRGSSAVRS